MSRFNDLVARLLTKQLDHFQQQLVALVALRSMVDQHDTERLRKSDCLEVCVVHKSQNGKDFAVRIGEPLFAPHGESANCLISTPSHNSRARPMTRNPSPLFLWGDTEPLVYPHHVKTFDLPKDGPVDYAQWEHPQETPKEITQSAVNQLRQVLSPGDFAIDIGAHTGDTTLPIALATGPTGLVLALEPNPYVFPVLAENARLNPSKARIDARNIAATQSDGQFVFHYSDRDYCNGGFKTQQKWPLFRRRHPLQVEGRDFYYLLKTEYPNWLPKLKYVKVDAEGYDLKILESIRPILSERRPTIACEVFRKLVASERFAIYDFLEDLGYDVAQFEPRTNQVGPPLPRQAMTKSKHFDLLATPRPPRLPRRRAA